MRILINSINFAPEPTSTGKITGEMATWLAQRGHKVRVVTSPPHYPYWKVYEGYASWRYRRETPVREARTGGTLEVFRCPVWVPLIPRSWRRILYLTSFFVSSFPVMLSQLTFRPDIVLLVEPTFLGSPQTLLTARLSGAVAWLHIQDLELDAAFQLKDFSAKWLKRLVRSVERVVLKRFDWVSSISDRMVQRICAKGVVEKRAVIFPNWVDTSAIHPLAEASAFRKEQAIPDSTIVALYTGNMGLKQGLGVLAETCERLSSRSDLVFLVAGDGPDRDLFAGRTASLRNVVLMPLQPLERLNQLLSAADIHLLPQLADAEDLVMPSKLAGLMASGRPTIATAHPGTQLYSVVQGRGIVSAPGDADALSAAIVHLAENSDLRRRLGMAAREYSVANLGREEILTRFESALAAACGQEIPAASRGELSPI